MTYEYGSESKRLELPNPYRLQNRLLWLCAVLLVGAGVLSLLWARGAMQEAALRLAAAPIVAGLLLIAAGLAAAATAATRLRFFFGRGRPASLAPEIPGGATGGSPAADQIKEFLRQGGLTYPEPAGAVEGLLYHWAPTLITAPREVQRLARLYAFNLAAIAATLVSFLFSWFVFGSPVTRPWIAILYFVFGLVFLLKPVLSQSKARVTSLSLVGLIAAAILAPVAIGLVGGEAAFARRLLARHPDIRDAVHGAGRLRPGDGGGARPGRRGAADAGQRRAAAPVDERAAGDADGRARPADAGELDRAHPEPPLCPHRPGDDRRHALGQLRRRAVRGEPAAADHRHAGADARLGVGRASPSRPAPARPLRHRAGDRRDRPVARLRAPFRRRRAAGRRTASRSPARRRSWRSSRRSASRRRRGSGAASTSNRCWSGSR